MGKNKTANIDMRSRYFKLIIYSDNAAQSALFDKILSGEQIFDSETKWEYIYILHKGFDDSKEHIHLYFAFEHPMRTVSLCRRFGFVNDLGEPDDQFCRAITGKFSDALLYLTHLNTPDKEQYAATDLRGSPSLIKLYLKEELRYASKKIEKRDAYVQVSDWINRQEGIISARQMVEFLIKHECFVIRHEPWLRMLWREHNSRLAYHAKKVLSDAIALDAEKWAQILADIQGEAIIMPDEWFDIDGGGMF